MNNTGNQGQQGEEPKDVTNPDLHDIKISIDSLTDQIKAQRGEQKNDSEWTRRTAKAAIAYTGITLVILIAAGYQSYIATAQLTLSQRAWIAPVKAEFERLAIDKPIITRITLDNVGHSPAIDTAHKSATTTNVIPNGYTGSWGRLPIWKTFIEDVEPIKCRQLKPMIDGDAFFPNNSRAANSIDLRHEVVSDNADILNAKKILVVFGCYAYRTMASDHVTFFCYYPHPVFEDNKTIWIWGTCPTWHYAN